MRKYLVGWLVTAAAEWWDVAGRVCTAKQLRILELRERHGFSLTQIAYATRLSVSTVRSQLRAAYHNIDQELTRKEPV